MMRGFDSIESMNAEELLVKRKRGSKKYIFAVASTCAIFFIIGLLIGYFSTSGNVTSGAQHIPSTGGDSFDFTKFLLENIDKDRIQETLRRYSSQPRLAGTELGEELAHTILKDWTGHGVENVHLATYNVLLSYPNTSQPNVVQVVNTSDGQVVFQSHSAEAPLTPQEDLSHAAPPFNSYSPAGNVSGDVVYVNYGRMEDFLFLANNLSVNLTGKIVIARYGRIYRGDKVRNAEHFSASAVILFSDPADFREGKEEGEDNTTTYPHSWWLPPSGVQRGTILTTHGDPLTPLYPSTDYAYRLPLSEADDHMPQIPCQPIGYGDASSILRLMGGARAPDSWQGGLNFTYNVGPGFLSHHQYCQVKVMVSNYRQQRPVHNVIGYIQGSEEPDRYVLVGNHHDAWVRGAVDPLSGSAALTEITRVFGLLLQQGHRPRRTVVFCSWDGEEYGLMGSMEWVEDHLKALQQGGVAYLNMDSAVWGNFSLYVGTSPLLQEAVYRAARQVPSPDPSAGQSLYDLWKARPIQLPTSESPSPFLTYSLGSGSDMATFYQRAGLSCVDMSMTYDQIHVPILTYPLYHSSYDTFLAYSSYIDPGFSATDSVTKLMAVLTSDLANGDLLPMSVGRYSAAVTKFHQSLMDKFQDLWQQHNVNVDAFSSAVSNFSLSTKAFQERLDSDRATITNSPLQLRRVNDQLMQLERAFLDPQGLPGRPDQKHILFAPSQFDAYTDTSFPGIMDTMFEINQGRDLWEQLKKQVYITTYTIQSAAASLSLLAL